MACPAWPSRGEWAADLVIAPYATFLTLTTDPEGALRNLSRLERLGMTGRCGFYEAADFTKGRAAGGGYSVVRSYMAHHVGMSMAALRQRAAGRRVCSPLFAGRGHGPGQRAA